MKATVSEMVTLKGYAKSERTLHGQPKDPAICSLQLQSLSKQRAGQT